MVNLAEDIHPLTEFKRRTGALAKRMKKTHRPLVLTVNGKAEMVVLDPKDFQRMVDRLQELETVEAIQLGMKDAAEGRVRPAREALEELREKLGIVPG